MTKSKSSLVTEEYLDKKFSKNTHEIIDVIHEISGRQTKLMLQVLDTVKRIRMDMNHHSVRLDDHAVRLEKLESKKN